MGLFSKRYISRSEEARVVAAIGDAERDNRGEVHVHLEAHYRGDGPLARAGELFVEHGLDRTAEGTGVLLYVAVLDRKVAVYAGEGLYGAMAPGFWQDAVDAVAEGFKRGDRAGGLVTALTAIGERLREVAAGEDVHGNELPNRVTFS